MERIRFINEDEMDGAYLVAANIDREGDLCIYLNGKLVAWLSADDLALHVSSVGREMGITLAE